MRGRRGRREARRRRPRCARRRAARARSAAASASAPRGSSSSRGSTRRSSSTERRGQRAALPAARRGRAQLAGRGVEHGQPELGAGPAAPPARARAPASTRRGSPTSPGVTTSTTSRRTSRRPAAARASSTCSQIATRWPSSASRARYWSAACTGTPHIGTASGLPLSRVVSAMSSSGAASSASRRNIS